MTERGNEMTEKVKITQEQADGIERYKQEMVKSLKTQFKNGFEKTPYEWAKPLVELGAEQILDAVQHGYEVEPEPLKINDWVTNHVGDGFRTGKIIGFTNVGLFVRFLNYETNEYYNEPFHSAQLEKSTPEEIAEEEERRKWAEIKEGDVLRKIPMAHEVAIYEGDADDESILVRNDSGQHLWRKSQVELYAKKVGDE